MGQEGGLWRDFDDWAEEAVALVGGFGGGEEEAVGGGQGGEVGGVGEVEGAGQVPAMDDQFVSGDGARDLAG